MNEVGALEFTNANYRGCEYPYAFLNGTVEVRARNQLNNNAQLSIIFMMNQGGSVCTNTYNGYMLVIRRSTAYIALFHTAWNLMAATDVIPIDENWHNYLITKAGNNFTVDFDGGVAISPVDATWSTSDRFGLRIYNNGGWEVDYIEITPM